MSTFPRAAIWAIAVTVLVPAGLFVLLIAYLSGNLPDGSRLVYDGFRFNCRGSVAYQLLIDGPQQAQIYIVVRDQPVLVGKLTKGDFAALGFEPYGVDSLTNAPAGRFAMAAFKEKQQLEFLSISDVPSLTIPFASASGKPLKMPLTARQIRAEFGAPVKYEWTYSKPQWR